MDTAKPAMRVVLAPERELLFFLLVVHIALYLAMVFVASAPVIILVFLTLPLSLAYFLRRYTWMTEKSAVQEVHIDRFDNLSVLLVSGDQKAAQLCAYRFVGNSILLCLNLDGVLLARTVVMGKRSTSDRQRRNWRIRLRQLNPEN